MKKCTMVMYFTRNQVEQEQDHIIEYPNAFIISTAKKVTPHLIREHFPWQRLPFGCPQNMKFGIKAGQSTYWLDLKENEDVPLYGKDTVFVKLSEGV